MINSRREQHSMGRITWTDYRAAGLRRILGTIKLALEDRIEDKLPLIKAPTLVIRGERDAVVDLGRKSNGPSAKWQTIYHSSCRAHG
jgi:2-hydroxy-6-oxonona-2,4-dienedioate hydrolase